ncbi:mechanosensitive ion channel family protein [Candidatus Saccharibacteria bacterium]|nr:mechanosensitive ion channel family protein [Candidatus Saccharibacteria bacterium]
MENLLKLIENIWVQRTIWSVILILFSFLIYRIISRLLTKKEKKNSRLLSNKKNKTFIRMLKSIVGYSLAIVTVLMVLQIFGVDVSSMLAGVGIASIVIGFALQDALKDIIRGFDIVSDGYYEIGDVIKYGDNTGQVISVGLRTTKIQDVGSMNIVSIANRNIDKVEVVSEYIFLTIPFPYETKLEKAETVMKEIVERIRKHEKITTATYQGITNLGESSLDFQLSLTCDPMAKLQTRRDALHVVVETLAEHKIEIPYPQLDIHNKK